jgi:hypothetical protein
LPLISSAQYHYSARASCCVFPVGRTQCVGRESSSKKLALSRQQLAPTAQCVNPCESRLYDKLLLLNMLPSKSAQAHDSRESRMGVRVGIPTALLSWPHRFPPASRCESRLCDKSLLLRSVPSKSAQAHDSRESRMRVRVGIPTALLSWPHRFPPASRCESILCDKSFLLNSLPPKSAQTHDSKESRMGGRPVGQWLVDSG